MSEQLCPFSGEDVSFIAAHPAFNLRVVRCPICKATRTIRSHSYSFPSHAPLSADPKSCERWQQVDVEWCIVEE